MLIHTTIYGPNPAYPNVWSLPLEKRTFGNEAMARHYIQREVERRQPQYLQGSARNTLDIALKHFRSTRRSKVRCAASLGYHESFEVRVTI